MTNRNNRQYGDGMTPTKLKSIRERAGLTQSAMANLLRIEDGRTIRRWESGERPVSGPASILYEMLDAGYMWECPRQKAQTAGEGT